MKKIFFRLLILTIAIYTIAFNSNSQENSQQIKIIKDDDVNEPIENNQSNTYSKNIDVNIKNYIIACTEIVDSWTPYSNLGYVVIFNKIFENNENWVNKPLLKKQLLEVLTSKKQRDLFFKGHIRYLGRNKSNFFMDIETMNRFTYTQFSGAKLTDYIFKNYGE